MQINLNVPVRLLLRLLRTLENIRDDYRTVHHRDLNLNPPVVDPDDGKVFYQSDQKLYEDELRERVRRAVESGDLDSLLS